MRVTSNAFSENLIAQLHSLSGRQVNLQNQIATGQRVLNPSDDPFAAQQILQMRDNSTALAQYRKNIETHREVTDMNHGAMRSLQSALNRVQEIAASIDGLDSVEDMQSYAREVDQQLRSIIGTANSKPRGDYLFGGNKSDTPPFAATTDASGRITAVTFQGSTSVASTEIAPGVLVSARIPGANPAGAGERGLLADARSGADLFAHLIALRDQLEAGDSTAILSTTRTQLQADEENLLFHVADNGALQARLESSLTLAKDEGLALNSEISARADVDLPETIVRLNQQQTTYQAALQSAGSMFDLSLLSFLR